MGIFPYLRQLMLDMAERQRNTEAASRASEANLETAEIGVSESENTAKGRRRRRGLSGLTIQKTTDALTGLNIPTKEDR